MADKLSLTRTGGSLAAKTTSGGDRHDVLIPNAAHHVRRLAPFLPMIAAAAANQWLVPYAALAAVFWALFVLNTAHYKGDIEIYSVILDPAAVDDALDAAVAEGFVITEYTSWGHLVYDLMQFAISHPTLEALWLDDSKLEQLNPGPVGSRPAGNDTYIAELKLSNMAPSSGTLVAMCLFEYTVSPRMQPASRFDDDYPWMRIAADVKEESCEVPGRLRTKITNSASAAQMAPHHKRELISFFRDSLVPLEMFHTSFDAMDDPDSETRQALVATLIEFHYHSEARHDILVKHTLDLCAATSVLRHVVLPSPSSLACYGLLISLATKMGHSSSKFDAAFVRFIDEELAKSKVVTLVQTDKLRAASGADKTAMITSHFDSLKGSSAPPPSLVTTTTSHSSTAPSSSPSVQSTPQLSVYLLSPEVRAIETGVAAALGESPPNFLKAVTLISRSRQPLLIRLLRNLDKLGASETFIRVPNLRKHVRPALEFCITADSDPDTHVLVVPERLKGFKMAHLFAPFWNNQLLQLNFHELPGLIAAKRQDDDAPNTTPIPPRDIRWGDATLNTAVGKYWDRAYNFRSFKSGAFSDIVDEANTRLTENVTLPAAKFRVLQADITKAMEIALEDIEKEMSVVENTSSHHTPWPNNGKRLLRVDSPFYSQLAKIDELLVGLRNKKHWDAEASSPRGQQMASKIKDMENQIKGRTTTDRDCHMTVCYLNTSQMLCWLCAAATHAESHTVAHSHSTCPRAGCDHNTSQQKHHCFAVLSQRICYSLCLFETPQTYAPRKA